MLAADQENEVATQSCTLARAPRRYSGTLMYMTRHRNTFCEKFFHVGGKNRKTYFSSDIGGTSFDPSKELGFSSLFLACNNPNYSHGKCLAVFLAGWLSVCAVEGLVDALISKKVAEQCWLSERY